MEQRVLWNENAAWVRKTFDDAITLSSKAQALFGGYANLEEAGQVIARHYENWLKNRFEIVVVGEFSTGKSTFINTLLRKDVLPSKVTPTTATINYLRHIEHGDGQEKAVIHFRDGNTAEVEFGQLEQYVTEMSKHLRVAYEVAYVDIFVDSPYLEDGVVIVDTPGLQALHAEHERITKEQIKRSNASIFLFNLEQPGKRSEYEFLKHLAESIDRIFFVGNRMDGVPPKELDEVIQSIEHGLRHNEYIQVPAEQAKLYAISAKQALKARDPYYETEEWRDWSPEKLLEASQFEQFEERLENYLFHGEKSQDLLKMPILAIDHFYQEIEKEMQRIEVLVSGEIDSVQLQAEKERLLQEVELRKLQLQDKERTVQGMLHDAIYQHEKHFNEHRSYIQQQYLDRVDEIVFAEELEENVHLLLVELNKEIGKLIDSSLTDLGHDVETAMKREIYSFELQIQPEAGAGEGITKAEREISVSTAGLKRGAASLADDVELRYKQEEQRLQEEKELLRNRIQMEQELDSAKEDQKLLRAQHRTDNRFHDLLLSNTDSTKKQYGILKKRKWFLPDKMDMIVVDNERYYELIKGKKTLMEEQKQEERDKLSEVESKRSKLAGSDTEFMDMKEWYEAQRELTRRKEEARMAQLRMMTQAETRHLEREKRQVKRQLENIFEDVRRGYRTLLRELDAIKLAQTYIKHYIEEKDRELKLKLQELQSKEQLLHENKAKQDEYRTRVSMVNEQIVAHRAELASLHLQLI
jgi:small GTP-binding protein